MPLGPDVKCCAVSFPAYLYSEPPRNIRLRHQVGMLFALDMVFDLEEWFYQFDEQGHSTLQSE